MPLTRIKSGDIGVLSENNYLSSSISNWRTYSDAAATSPVDGIGGSPTITFVQDSSAPLNYSGDFRFTNTGGVSRQGQGVSVDFEIENRHKAKILQIVLDYELVSGTLASNDLRLYIIQDPTGTPVVIEPVNTGLQTLIVDSSLKHIATFQTHVSIKNYRLCIHIGSTGTNGYIVDFANFKIGESAQSMGAVITDWASYTPTINGITSSSSSFQWRRVGGSVEITGSFTFSSSVSGTFQLPLPSGLSISSTITRKTLFGKLHLGKATADGSNPQWFLIGNGGNSFLTLALQSSNTASTLSDYPSNGTGAGSGDIFTMFASVPIAGWGSSVAMSSDSGDGRVVAARATVNNTLSVTANQPIAWQNIVNDTHGGFNSGKYTVPISGYYQIFAGTYSGTASGTLYAAVDGAIVSQGGPISAEYAGTFISDTIFVRAGQVVDIRLDATVTLTSSSFINRFSIARISAGSQTIGTQETVACRYEKTDGANVLSSATDMIYNLRIRDTHGAYNTANGEYTVPISGYYQINCIVGLSTGSLYNIHVLKNGSVTDFTTVGGVTTMNRRNLSIGNYYLAGDKIKIQALADTTRSTDTQAGANTLFICRLGI